MFLHIFIHIYIYLHILTYLVNSNKIRQFIPLCKQQRIYLFIVLNYHYKTIRQKKNSYIQQKLGNRKFWDLIALNLNKRMEINVFQRKSEEKSIGCFFSFTNSKIF
jgi:hypothetical protein